ncbi:HET domain-containing protein [Pyrenophora tritici-repentis]|nr:HET domain-containing protein [Pyrenophora tritici-repentis]KAI0614828.1 HET domain-containing protein [Pyrenophora tritici-repentis]
MWLICTSTLKLRLFITNIPDYVMLSHTWGDGEVTFDDIDKPHAKGMAGYSKIVECCAKALSTGFEWAWIYTCCIDNRSSAELSEAINSMHKWYWDAAICYAYMSDCTPETLNAELFRLGIVARTEAMYEANASRRREFQASRWFKRGWTLQELLAPEVIKFYDADWIQIGTKSSLLEPIFTATEIEEQHISDRDTIQHASISTKFSWASSRTTTRVEDVAYCLLGLGLVNVNMPMLYGEGERAFYRLQLEVIKHSNDHTIFAWESSNEAWLPTSMFASSPTQFASASQLLRTPPQVQGQLEPYELTNHGLRMTLPCIPVGDNRIVTVLDCANTSSDHVGVWLRLMKVGRYERLPNLRVFISKAELIDASQKTIYIQADKQISLKRRNKG